MAEEAEEIQEEAQDDANKKHINLVLSDKEDSDVIRVYEVIKAVSGVSNKEIFKLGLNAYKESDDFKEKAKIVKDMVA